MKKLTRVLILLLLLPLCLRAETRPPTEPPPKLPPKLPTEPSDLVSGPQVSTAEAPVSNEYLAKSRLWKAPDYSNQVGALGYDEATFEIPKGMERRVAFWMDIYTKYTTNQGLLHDSHFIDVVYEKVDFTEIMKDESKSPSQKNRARERLVKERKKHVASILRKLEKVKSSQDLNEEELRYWKMFEEIKEAKKFSRASEKGRLRFQLGQKDRFILGIYYSGRYLREMEKIFREEKLPVELTRLPFVESSFNINARSRVGASGIWQFMRRTARPFMKITSAVDERNDPIQATRSSAQLLRQNYSMLQSWPLAVTGYNHGPYGVKTIVNKLRTQSLAEIIDRYSSSRFGFASENFYACFLAAVAAEREATKHYGEVKWSLELENVELEVSKDLPYEKLLSWFGGDADQTELYNPHLLKRVRKGKISIPKGTFVRVPPERAQLARAELAARKQETKPQKSVQKSVEKKGRKPARVGGSAKPKCPKSRRSECR